MILVRRCLLAENDRSCKVVTSTGFSSAPGTIFIRTKIFTYKMDIASAKGWSKLRDVC